MICCVCLYVREGIAPDAVTVINGYAVCEDHLGIVAQGREWNSILVIAGRRVREGMPFTPTARPLHQDPA
jgi:hypothetical protein